jgi:hypothetical protein
MSDMQMVNMVLLSIACALNSITLALHMWGIF